MSTETATGDSYVSEAVEDNWGYLVGGGIVLGVLGVLAIVFPFVTGVALSLLLGALLVVGSLVYFASAFSAQGWRGFAWHVLLGLVYAVAGITLMANPVVGLATLTVLLVAYFLVDGVVEIVMGVRLLGQRGAWWAIASGAVSLVLAGLVWVEWPSSALWAVGLLFGVGLLTSGFSMVAIGVGGRRVEEPTETMAGAGEV